MPRKEKGAQSPFSFRHRLPQSSCGQAITSTGPVAAAASSVPAAEPAVAVEAAAAAGVVAAAAAAVALALPYGQIA